MKKNSRDNGALPLVRFMEKRYPLLTRYVLANNLAPVPALRLWESLLQEFADIESTSERFLKVARAFRKTLDLPPLVTRDRFNSALDAINRGTAPADVASDLACGDSQ